VKIQSCNRALIKTKSNSTNINPLPQPPCLALFLLETPNPTSFRSNKERIAQKRTKKRKKNYQIPIDIDNTAKKRNPKKEIQRIKNLWSRFFSLNTDKKDRFELLSILQKQ